MNREEQELRVGLVASAPHEDAPRVHQILAGDQVVAEIEFPPRTEGYDAIPEMGDDLPEAVKQWVVKNEYIRIPFWVTLRRTEGSLAVRNFSLVVEVTDEEMRLEPLVDDYVPKAKWEDLPVKGTITVDVGYAFDPIGGILKLIQAIKGGGGKPPNDPEKPGPPPHEDPEKPPAPPPTPPNEDPEPYVIRAEGNEVKAIFTLEIKPSIRTIEAGRHGKGVWWNYVHRPFKDLADEHQYVITVKRPRRMTQLTLVVREAKATFTRIGWPDKSITTTDEIPVRLPWLEAP